MKTGLVLIAVTACAWLTFAWVLMLEVGVAHRDWWPLMPLMSYHVALAFSTIGVMFGVIMGILKAFTGDDR